MRVKHAVVLFLALLVIAATAVESRASVSQAAALFLRIAPGARAAGMGEAFVAVADDPTTVHWNPAGLGAYPLSDAWFEEEIPSQYRPVRGTTVLKSRGGASFQAFDMWLLTPRGLARYDNKRWYEGEVFSTRTDQTVEKIVADYFHVTDSALLATMIQRVAEANNKESLDSLNQFRDQVLAAVGPDAPVRAELSAWFDTLAVAWPECRINWSNVAQARSQFVSGYKDSSLSEQDIDRINFSLEHAKTRFIPEEITIPYATTFAGEPTCIVSFGEPMAMVVGTTAGLVKYSGRNWQTISGAEAGLPSNNITCLHAAGSLVIVGTDSGLVRYNGLTIEKYDSTANAPAGVVQAVGGSSSSDLYAVVGNELYHYNGRFWSNSFTYVAVLDDTPERIADRFAIYQTAGERAAYLEKLAAMPSPRKGAAKAADSAAVPTAGAYAAGDTLTVPYLGGLQSKVNVIRVAPDRSVWLGTDHGVFYLSQNRWVVPGYRLDTLKQDLSRDSALAILIADRKFSDTASAESYRAALLAFNDGLGETLTAGTTLRVYRNPTSAPVRDINFFGPRGFVATDAGLLEYDGAEWGRSDVKGFGKEPTKTVATVKDQLWFVGEEKIALLGTGRTEISMMYVKWLPALADDLYYTNFCMTHNFGSLGTFGGDFTYLSYGTQTATNSEGKILGTFDAFDLALTVAYGTSLSSNLKAGLGAKVIYSHLAEKGAGTEIGKPTATGFALDAGLLYRVSSRMNLGAVLSNLGPQLTYIDKAQADDLPRNLAVGLSYKLMQSEYTRLMVTTDVNKMLVGLDDGLSKEMQEVIINSGVEFAYANLIAVRGGYIYDQEGQIKVFTVGAGLSLLDRFSFDFAYIPSQKDAALNNILRLSVSVLP